MIDEIDLEGASEHMGLLVPHPNRVRYRMRVEINMPRFLSMRAAYVPLGSCLACDLFDYRRPEPLRSKIPPMPDVVSEFDWERTAAWLEAIDLEGPLRPPSVPEYEDALRDAVTGDTSDCVRPFCEHWVPVTVRAVDDPAWGRSCAHPGWTNVLQPLAGQTGVLVHNTW